MLPPRSPTPDPDSPGARLRRLIAAGTIAVPGAYNAAVALLIEAAGFPAVYVSGAGLANGAAGLPDIGLLTQTEVAALSRYITAAVRVPVIIDADTGFGEILNVQRTVSAFEEIGAAGVQIEDQVNPKRCGHLAGKQVVPAAEMARRVAAAAEARSDPGFVIIARVDSRSVHGLEDAIARGQLYSRSGADLIFPEGLESAAEFAAYAKAVPAPLLANMTEFGRSPALSVDELRAMGYRVVIFPQTAFRVMMKAAEQALRTLAGEGTARSLIPDMQTRQELYDLLRYQSYADRDEKIAGFEVGLDPIPGGREGDHDEQRDL